GNRPGAAVFVQLTVTAKNHSVRSDLSMGHPLRVHPRPPVQRLDAQPSIRKICCLAAGENQPLQKRVLLVVKVRCTSWNADSSIRRPTTQAMDHCRISLRV